MSYSRAIETDITSASKLRSSCDACGIAKVKCDRSRPTCGRCTSSNTVCNYGVSRKAGKPSRKRPVDLAAVSSVPHSKRPSLTNTTANIMNFKVTGAHGTDHSHSHGPLGQSTNFGPSTQLSPMKTSIDFSIPSTTNLTSGPEEQDMLDYQFFTPLSLDDWAQFEGPDSGTGTVSGLQNGDMATGELPAKTDSHNCFQEAHNILGGLLEYQGLSEITPDDKGMNVMDLVLQTNKTATDRLDQLLNCSCTRPPHLTMLYGSIISRILSGYQQLADCVSSKFRGSMGSRATCGSQSPSDCLKSRTDEIAVADTPGLPRFASTQLPYSMESLTIIQPCLGVFLGTQILGYELKRVRGLIETLTTVDSREDSVNGVEKLSSSLGQWLRAEHARAMSVARDIIKIHNEGVDRAMKESLDR